mmetsp:Transcript_30320/g.64981  ORF Transcript_30320/g.64981 Transcript_30320/m.64981 type:complete len:94 (+) Transcript_30320:1025-1306(+)
MGSNRQSFTRNEVNIIAVQADTIRNVKNGRLNPSFLVDSKSTHVRYGCPCFLLQAASSAHSTSILTPAKWSYKPKIPQGFTVPYFLRRFSLAN